MNTYWDRVTKSRIGRRRLLVTTGSAGLGAAFLAACGGSDSSSSSGGTKPEPNSLVSALADETKSAKKGGVLKFHAPFEFVHLDPQQAAQSGIQPLIYS